MTVKRLNWGENFYLQVATADFNDCQILNKRQGMAIRKANSQPKIFPK
jgi:hypothetical protein